MMITIRILITIAMGFNWFHMPVIIIEVSFVIHLITLNIVEKVILVKTKVVITFLASFVVVTYLKPLAILDFLNVG